MMLREIPGKLRKIMNKKQKFEKSMKTDFIKFIHSDILIHSLSYLIFGIHI